MFQWKKLTAFLLAGAMIAFTGCSGGAGTADSHAVRRFRLCVKRRTKGHNGQDRARLRAGQS